MSLILIIVISANCEFDNASHSGLITPQNTSKGFIFTATSKAFNNTTGLGISKNESKDREMPSSGLDLLIHNFTSRLRVFILETVFDVHGFEAAGDDLRSHLALIIEIAASQAMDNLTTKLQLEFAQHMFQTMADSIELLKYYESIEVAGRHFVCSVIDLNVRLLVLHDSVGLPDLSNELLFVQVNSYLQYLKLIRKAFEAADRVPFGRRRVFYAQYELAENTLINLKAHFQKRGKGGRTGREG